MDLVLSQVHGIRCLSSGNAYNADSQLKGETFSRFVRNGIVFIMNDKDPFVKLHAEGKLYSVELIEGTRTNDAGEIVSTLAVGNYITKAQKLEDKRFSCEEESITVDSFKRDFSNVAEII